MAVDWDVVYSQIKDALADLGISDPHDYRALIIRELWRTKCPTCLPQDGEGHTNYFVVRALVKDVDAGSDIVCGCRPYAVTEDIYTAFCKLSEKLPVPDAPKCGYGWTLFDDQGNPIFAPNPIPNPPVPPGPPDIPGVTTPISPPARRKDNTLLGVLGLLGLVAGAFALSRKR